MAQIKKAMIFAAGLGTRFKPWTDSHPKALAVINGKTLLQRNIEYLQQFGITNVVVNVHHFGGQIVEQLRKNRGWGSHVEISDESEMVLETGGGLLKAKDLLNQSPFLTINVDILTDVDLYAMMQAHENNKDLITLAVTNRNTSRYLLFDEHNSLCGWRNKATGEEKIAVATQSYKEKAYSGLAIFEPSIFDLLTFSGKFSLIDVYLSLASSQKISGFDHSGSRFIDVGKPESVAKAELMFTAEQ